MTDAQDLALAPILEGRDVLLRAATGAGKTLAFLLPILQRKLSAEAAEGSFALVLVPTRELAIQIHKVCQGFARVTGTKSVVLSGGQERRYQLALLRRRPEILIATPGRLMEFLEQDAAILEDVRVLVLDEADRMLDLGFRDPVLAIADACPQREQTLMFSATLGHAAVTRLATGLLVDPVKLDTGKSGQMPLNLTHQCIYADDAEHKIRLLQALIEQEPARKSIVFCNQRQRVERLAKMLGREFRAGTLHGDMTQDERRATLNSFRSGSITRLIATDVAARGLDIAAMDMVVNFDMPHSGNDYLHRAGRAGRDGEPGIVVSLVASPDWNLSESIQRYLECPFDTRVISGMKARFSGAPTGKKKLEKRKAAAIASGKKKPSGGGSAPAPKEKERWRTRKNLGKRRKASAAPANPDGSGPWRK